MPLAEVLRYRHAQLYLAGYRLRRAGRVADQRQARRRARWEEASARYGPARK